MTKVMLVEDDLTMLSLMSSLLEFEGYEVVKLDGNGRPDSLMETIRREVPELVIMDVHLRHANGFDLLRQVRQDKDLKSVRVLMSSGMDVSSRCINEGADGFIMKPYMPEDLIGKIRDMLGE
jgi:DNA-binding response OmpR family regulator